MTPEQFESQVLGIALAFFVAAALVSFYIFAEWVASKPDRDARKAKR